MKAGVNFSATGHYGGTPACWAAEKGSAEALRWLKEAQLGLGPRAKVPLIKVKV